MGPGVSPNLGLHQGRLSVGMTVEWGLCAFLLTTVNSQENRQVVCELRNGVEAATEDGASSNYARKVKKLI